MTSSCAAPREYSTWQLPACEEIWLALAPLVQCTTFLFRDLESSCPSLCLHKNCIAQIWKGEFLLLLYEAMQDESAELCFIFRSTHSVLYFPLENIVSEILLHIRCNKPVKVPLTLVHYRKYCTWHGLGANIALGFASCYISLLTTPLCDISRSALAAVL